MEDKLQITRADCTCPKGKGQACGHISAVLYQVAKYKKLKLKVVPEDVAKTSIPQAWHIPRGDKITGAHVQNVILLGQKGKDLNSEKEVKSVKSTLYNAVKGDIPDYTNLYQPLAIAHPDSQILPAIKESVDKTVNTNFGMAAKGSLLSYKQKVSPDYISNIYTEQFPQMPMCNFMINN